MPSIMNRTNDTLEALELAIAANHGSIRLAANELQIRPHEVRMWMASDPEVQTRLHNARMIGHASLEDEAIRRGVEGIEEDVYYQGDVVGTRKVYSDGLLTTLLKARVKEYAQEQASTALTVNVAVMPRASTYEEWLTQRATALEAPQDPQELIEDAHYEEAPLGVLRDVL